MVHLGTTTLQTKNLTLRKFFISDVESLYKNWGNDFETVKFMRLIKHTNELDTMQFVRSIIESYYKLDFYRWAICLKSIDEIIGFIGMSTLSEQDLIADFGYSIGRSFWNNGYATEALTAVLNFGLNKVGYNRMEAYHSIRNEASGMVMKKSGMVYEGLAREKYKSQLGFEDCKLYSILKKDLAI